MALLEVRDVTVSFGGILALDGLTFDVDDGRVSGLIGPNGAGKTTMFNVVTRIYEPLHGTVTYDGHDLLRLPGYRMSGLGIARTFQNLALWPGLSVLDNVVMGDCTRTRAGFVTSALRWGTRHEERRLRARAYAVLREFDLSDVAFRPATGLPFGTLKRVELARAIMGAPRFLMLDEPASGLTHAEVDDLGSLIRSLRDRYDLTVLLVEHHIRMVMSLCDHIVVLNLGRLIAEGPPEEVRNDPAVVEAYLGTRAA